MLHTAAKLWLTGVITNEYRTHINPVAARATGTSFRYKISKKPGARQMHTEVLGYTQLVCGTTQVFYTCSDQTPFHQGCPKKHSLGSYMTVRMWLYESIGVFFTCWMIHERGKLGNTCGCGSSRHFLKDEVSSCGSSDCCTKVKTKILGDILCNRHSVGLRVTIKILKFKH